MIAAMAQEVERRLGKAEVTGSNPVSSLFNKALKRKGLIFVVFILSKKRIVTAVDSDVLLLLFAVDFFINGG